MATPQPGVYAKGNEVRVADTARDAVAAVYQGFKKVESEVAVESPVDEVPTPQDVNDVPEFPYPFEDSDKD